MRIEIADCVECSRPAAAVKLPSRETQYSASRCLRGIRIHINHFDGSRSNNTACNYGVALFSISAHQSGFSRAMWARSQLVSTPAINPMEQGMSARPFPAKASPWLAAASFALAITGTCASASAQTAAQITTGGDRKLLHHSGSSRELHQRNSKLLRMAPSTSGGGFENLRRIDAGQAQFGITHPETMSQTCT